MFAKITNHQYIAQAISGVEIPKSNGKIRLLGVPTVVERVLQQAVHQAITPLFELQLHFHSFGFRPEKNAHHGGTHLGAKFEFSLSRALHLK